MFDKNKFSQRFKINSTRLQKWDYASPGYYFITICIKNREPYFGNITNGKMILNDVGKIIQHYWLQIPNHFNNTNLDQYIIMPNHLHGIIEICGEYDNGTKYYNDANIIRRDKALPCLYKNKTPKYKLNTNHFGKNRFQNQGKGTISAIIGSFKSICTRNIRQSHIPNFYWQSRFFEHVIKNQRALYVIRKYIKNNPQKWEHDRNNKKGLWI